jgi:hypothetical protein
MTIDFGGRAESMNHRYRYCKPLYRYIINKERKTENCCVRAMTPGLWKKGTERDWDESRKGKQKKGTGVNYLHWPNGLGIPKFCKVTFGLAEPHFLA